MHLRIAAIYSAEWDGTFLPTNRGGKKIHSTPYCG